MSTTTSYPTARAVVMPISPAVSDTLVLRFPSKSSGDVLDYTFDAGAWFTDAGETDGAATVTVTPGSGAPDLVVKSQTLAAGVLTLWLAGGVVGTDYQIQVGITTPGGRTLSRALWLRCVALFSEGT